MDVLDGQLSFVDVGLWSGRTCRDARVQETQEEQTSKRSSKKSQGLSAKKLPLFLFLKRDGLEPGACMEWETMELHSVSPINSTTLNGGAFLNEENGCLYLPTSMASPQGKYYLTLNIGEKPREPKPTKLSEILEEMPDGKYSLSSRACQGILNRAERRGKELPEILREALERQAVGDPQD